ncbi:MAG: glycoside hydrolase family 13 protein, partial [Promethearchaeota archaeon]
ASDDLFDYYETIIEFPVISLFYLFQLDDGKNCLFYGNYRFFSEQPEDPSHMFCKPVLAEEDFFQIPEWVQTAVGYALFPDRFYRPKNAIASKNRKLIPWSNKNPGYDDFLGGTLKGITAKLDYLDDLGINFLYLNPIFKSTSPHRYNITDYYKIDELLGNEEDLHELIDAAHNRGMRVIFDAVFNHSAVDFFAFKNLKKEGENSKYKDWYFPEHLPFNEQDFKKRTPPYKTFGYHQYMPKLRHANKETADYFIEVGKYWVEEFDIDGWRLDVADEISHDFWRRFRKEIKAIKPEALIVGEIWYESSSWLQGDQFDSVMNYLFFCAVKWYFAMDQITLKEFNHELGRIQGTYNHHASQSLWNLIGSHDTSRILSECKNEMWRLKLAILMQMTFPGVPVIYYGDEIAMVGASEREARCGMKWEIDKHNLEIKKYYKNLIKLRKEKSALIFGDFEEILMENKKDFYGFERKYQKDRIRVYLNKGNKESKIHLTGEWMNLIKHKKILKDLYVPAKSGTILEIIND